MNNQAKVKKKIIVIQSNSSITNESKIMSCQKERKNNNRMSCRKFRGAVVQSGAADLRTAEIKDH